MMYFWALALVGLAVIGGDSCMRGREFDSQCQMDHFSNSFVVNFCWCLKGLKINHFNVCKNKKFTLTESYI